MIHIDFKELSARLHADVNHKYDDKPYTIHLNMVEAVHQEFKDDCDLDDKILSIACWGHDLIEDCRVTPNDLIAFKFPLEAVKIIYALTNEKGWNRSERANDKYYHGIKETAGATFVKMCDRIANVRYSKMMGSSMFDKYRKENDQFMSKVGADSFPKMKQYLINLFNNDI